MKIFLFLVIFSQTIFAKDLHPQSIELLGQAKAQKIATSSIKTQLFIDEVLKARLPSKFKKDYKNIRNTIISNSKKYELDPIFVLAIIAGESSFNPKADGPVGEMGLMQLRPKTAKWITEEYLNKKWQGNKVLYNPYENIRIGTSYLRFLRSRFSNSSEYISAYNLGPTQLKEALKRNVKPKDYTKHVMKRYIVFHKNH